MMMWAATIVTIALSLHLPHPSAAFSPTILFRNEPLIVPARAGRSGGRRPFSVARDGPSQSSQHHRRCRHVAHHATNGNFEEAPNKAPATTTSTNALVNAATLRFNNKLNTLAKSYDATTAPRVEKMLLSALENYQFYVKYNQHNNNNKNNNNNSNVIMENNSELIIPNTISFTNAITAWARCTRKDSAKRAQALLDRMLSLYKEGKMLQQQQLLRDEEGGNDKNGETNENNEDGGGGGGGGGGETNKQTAPIKNAIKNPWEHVKPNKISYNSVITAWARSTERGSARKAEELLRRMYEFYEEEGGVDMNVKPDSRSFNAVINAVARSREKNCADRAKFLLDEMGRLYNEGDEDLVPDALTFGAIINAYANSLEEGASDKAAQLLMHMESLYQLGFENAKPATFVYNACMNAFAKDPLGGSDGSDSGMSSAEKAEQLLNSMEKRYEEEMDERVKPDCISYSTVINAHANCGTPQSGANADEILIRMIHRYLTGDKDCKPNAISFTAAIKAHSSAINATLSILDDDDNYDNDDDEEEKGKGGFEKESSRSIDVTRSNIQDNPQIKSSAKRCEELLQQLCLLYQTFGNDRALKPTAVTFDLVTRVYLQLDDEEGLSRVNELRDALMKKESSKH